MKQLRRRIRRLIPLYSLWSLRKGYLADIGWLRSFHAGQCVAADGSPRPWLTFPVIHFLSSRISKELTVFEYGCGNSTLWWAERVKRVVSCEHDQQWLERMRTMVPAHVDLRPFPLSVDGDYARSAAASGEQFDVIVVDGRDRVNCALRCLPALKAAGVLIWDNTDRDRYAEGISRLIALGFKRLEFQGMCALQTAMSETSIFYRPGNILAI